MGIEKIGLKIFNPIVEKWVQKAGVKSILQARTPIFHGINPTLTYTPSGESFALPRFCTQEMKQARRMNKIAIHQAKAGEVVRTYPRATPQDLKRLTSETIEDSYSRVEWINPKDGRVYNLLKQGETKDGKIIVRILNEDGAFIKEAQLSPKKIVIIDNFEDNKCLYDVSHGNVVQIFAKRNNPFAVIEIIDKKNLFAGESEYNQIFKQLLERIKSGEGIDYISCSHGKMCYTTVKHARGQNILFKDITDTASDRTRIFYAAGNEHTQAKQSTNQALLVTQKVEGVGSLSRDSGKISYFSASRNSFFTQHYEIGEYNLRPTKFGVNITGLRGTDIEIKHPHFIQQVKDNPIIGHSKERIDKILIKLEKEYNELLRQRSEMFKTHNVSLKKSKEIEERMNIISKRLNKLRNYISFTTVKTGKYESTNELYGTSYSTPVRVAKLALNDMMEGIL